ncbi:helix-turn-helix transcriptional regulator [Paenibacillus sp. HN-1]|uniref:helix-turn-helix domain-containing protein n=1 Tax=Paenibacillus TaxID=44249 RepID=UPI001CA85BEA|nr:MULTISPECIES: helix-turn-helix transcriptional regulator [Paenibacillus]MBY9077159.1 helix-turn-helix transcriptional regulator [Paenibacillus sp. CGMCC 1.18879]MBY9084445.1 helix-turn-helix transcriptional regulator [Paenibacillus sinensis]
MYEKFLALLEKSEKTSYQVAKETGISTATLTNWKQGNYKPKADKLKILADYFGVTVDYFLQEETAVE